MDTTRHNITDCLSQESVYTQHAIGHVGAMLATLKQHNITHIVMAGDLKRPSLRDLSLDWIGTKWMARLGMSAFSGDDTILSKLVQFIEGEGFTVISPHDIMPLLTQSKGTLSKTHPDQNALYDIEKGMRLIHTLSPFDIGQAVIVRDGYVIGIEAAEGTRALITRCGDLLKHKKDSDTSRTVSGVLIKSAKNHQSMKVDVPTIGPDTIEQVYQAGLAGIALGYGVTQILDEEKVLKQCEAYHIFLHICDPHPVNHIKE